MICEYTAKKYCCEDISLIDNYNEAINDKEQTWQIHHKLETQLNKDVKELIKQNLYFNRPASELIFLTKKDHMLLHRGKKRSEETKRKISKVRTGAVYGHYKKASTQDSGNMHSNALF